MATAFNPKGAAEDVMSAYWIGEGFPVDPVEIAHELGLDVWIAPLPDEVSGMLIKREGEPPAIYLNSADPDARQRFTCAHELGHYMIHVDDGTKELSFVDRRDPIATQGTNRDEVLANGFAANLLMPAATVQRRQRMGDSSAQMAEFFGVSLAAMKNRLVNLHLA